MGKKRKPILASFLLEIGGSKVKIAVGSLNPAKINAVKQALIKEGIEVIGVKVPSNVSAQPIGDEETKQGAINRALATVEESGANIGIGLEGGVDDTKVGMLVNNWGALATKEGEIYVASGMRIYLPEEVAEGVRSGKELGHVMEEYTKKNDVRSKEGAVGIFTNGYVTRIDMFSHVVKLLLGQYEYNRK
jgi:inosine/xanthosine triphosphatase